MKMNWMSTLLKAHCKPLFLLVMVLALGSGNVRAQLLLQHLTGTDPAVPGFIANNIQASAPPTRFNTVDPPIFCPSGLSLSGTAIVPAIDITNPEANGYVGFSFRTNGGFAATMTGFSMQLRRNSNGPTQAFVRYRIDGGPWVSSGAVQAITDNQGLCLENSASTPLQWTGFSPITICPGLNVDFQIAFGGSGNANIGRVQLFDVQILGAVNSLENQITRPADSVFCGPGNPGIILGSALNLMPKDTAFGWQQSIDTGKTWTNISGAASRHYAPGLLTRHTQFRRIGGVCRSLPIDINDPSNFSNIITIDIKQDPDIADAGDDQTDICGATATTLNATAPLASKGKGEWIVGSGQVSGFTFIGGQDNPRATFSGQRGTLYKLIWRVSNAPCAFKEDSVFIQFNQVAGTAEAGPIRRTCALPAQAGTVSLAAQAVPNGFGTGTWSVATGNGFFFSDITNPTSTFTGTSGQTYKLYWTVLNVPCGQTRDSTTVQILTSDNTVNAGVDQLELCLGANPSTFMNANTPASNVIANWSVASGSGGSFVDPSNPRTSFRGVPGQSYSLVWAINYGQCGTFRDTVVVSFLRAPEKTFAGLDVDTCAPANITELDIRLNGGLPVDGTIGAWRIDPSSDLDGFFALPSDTANRNGNFTAITDSTYFLTWNTKSGFCIEKSDTVRIRVYSRITDADIDFDTTAIQVCNRTETFIAALRPKKGVGFWTIDPSSNKGGRFQDARRHATRFFGLMDSTYILYWNLANGNCPMQRRRLVVQFFSPTEAPFAGRDIDTCVSAASYATNPVTVVAKTPRLATGRWTVKSTDPNGVNITFGAQTSPATTVIPDNFGPNGRIKIELYWNIQNGNCVIRRDSMVLTLNDSASRGVTAGTDVERCSKDSTPNLDSVQLAAVLPAIGQGRWRFTADSPPGGIIKEPTKENSWFIAPNNGVYKLIWAISNNACADERRTRDTVVITFRPTPKKPNAGPDQKFCFRNGIPNFTTILTGSKPRGKGRWFIVPAGSAPGATIVGRDTARNIQVRLPTIGQYVFERFDSTSNQCDPARDTVVVTLFPETDLPVLPRTIYDTCGVDSLIIRGVTPSPSGAVSWWTIGKRSADGGFITDTTLQNPTFKGIYDSTYWAVFHVQSGVCPIRRDSIRIRMSIPVPPVEAGRDIDTCVNRNQFAQVRLQAKGIPGVFGRWRILPFSNGGGAFPNGIRDTLNPNALFRGRADSTYLLEWTLRKGTCAAKSDTIRLRFSSPPSVANAGPDIDTCYDSPPNTSGKYFVRLKADTTQRRQGQWFLVNNGALGGRMSDSLNPEGMFEGFADQTYLLDWVTSKPGCTTSFTDRVQVRFFAPPADVDAGESDTLCGVESVRLNASAPQFPTGRWTVIGNEIGIPPSTGGVFSNPTLPNCVFSGRQNTLYTLEWRVSSSNLCTPSYKADTIKIYFYRNPDTAYAGLSIDSMCDTLTILNANLPRGGTGRGVWDIRSGDGGLVVDTLRANSVFVGRPGRTYRLRWTVKNEICGSVFDEITLSYSARPPVLQVFDTAVCGDGKGATLVATGVSEGSFRWYRTLDDTIPIPNQTTGRFRIDTVKAGTTYFVSSVVNGCEGIKQRVRVNKYAIPRGNVSPKEATIELGESVRLNATGGAAYLWSPPDGLDNAKIARPFASPKETTTYTVRVISRDSCSDIHQVTVKVIKNLFIPNAFTPNEDGVNDNWVLRSIENYPKCKVEVFNRWGIRLFSSNGYKTPWDGKYSGQYVPLGAYTYVVDLGDGSPVQSGTVTVVR